MSEKEIKKTTEDVENKEVPTSQIDDSENENKASDDNTINIESDQLDNDVDDVPNQANIEGKSDEIVQEDVIEKVKVSVEVDSMEEIDEKQLDNLNAGDKEVDDNNFDWDKLDSNDYSEKEWKELEKEYLPTLSSVEDKKVLDGKVVRVTDREVIVDINFKSDGVITRTEFRYNPDLKAGDVVEVLVEKQEDKNGQLILSHRRARVLRAWEKVNTAEDTGEIVEGVIKSRTKGGMIVDVFGIEG